MSFLETAMEDDDTPIDFKVPGNRIHFGSLEEKEKERLKHQHANADGADSEMGGMVFESTARADDNEDDDKDDAVDVEKDDKKYEQQLSSEVQAGVAAGNIQLPSTAAFELPEESRKAQEAQQKKYEELLLKRRARRLAVPTNDREVRARLRLLDEPITLFGEREMERRDRLRETMVHLEAEGEIEKLQKAAGTAMIEDFDGAEGVQTELFYTEGTAELLHARGEISQYSLRRAQERILAAKRRREDPDEDSEDEEEEVLKTVSATTMQCSEIGDERPLSGCAFSPDFSLLATCSWSGQGRIWTVPAVQRKETLKFHTERATDIAFHPHSCVSLSPDSANLATASADRFAVLWSLSGRILAKLDGHLDRLARLAFHPSGRYLGTTSFDKTWRLWDVGTGREVLLQEGHARSVYGIAFQKDGGLAATTGLDALARVWDLRTGKSILALEGHVKPVLGVDFSPNGYHLATGGEDHTCRIWDLRKKGCLYTIPAHTALLSAIKWEPRDGHFLVTASYDSTARMWGARDFKPVRTLAGHEEKIMGVDVAPEGQFIATVGYDRSIKLWSVEEDVEDEPME